VDDWISWITVAVAAAGLVWLYRVHRIAFFLGCFGFLTLLPGSNLAIPIGTIMAERFMYLPAIGFMGCLVLGVYAAGERMGNRAFAPLLLALIGTGFAVRTWARNSDWQDDITLGTATVRSSPESFKGHKILAVALMESDPGHAQINREVEEARQSMALIDSLPDFRSDPAIYRLAATLYLNQGDPLRGHDSLGRPVNTTGSSQAYQSALRALQRNAAIIQAIRTHNPELKRLAANSPSGYVDEEAARLFSMLYARLGDVDKALDAAIQARGADPLNPEMYLQIADVFLAAGRREDAATALMDGMIVTQDMKVDRNWWAYTKMAVSTPRDAPSSPGQTARRSILRAGPFMSISARSPRIRSKLGWRLGGGTLRTN
jgi:protein O-mannosyl-transferase